MVLPTGTAGSIPVRSTKLEIESYSKPELNLVKGIRPENLSRGRRRSNEENLAHVLELVYRLVSETRYCGFESHLAHQHAPLVEWQTR